jgi:hypothetical protein
MSATQERRKRSRAAAAEEIRRHHEEQARQHQGEERAQSSAKTHKPIEFCDVKPQPVTWHWFPRIPAGHMTLIAGKGGAGKGQVAMHAAACTTTGKAWPDGEPGPEPGHVLWCETEDPLDQVIIPRAISAGVDRTRATFVDNQSFPALGDLGSYIRRRETTLIVMSPLISFLAGLVNMRDEQNVRAALQALLSAIAGTNCAILGLTHANKKPDLAAIERILGAVAFANFVRSALLIGNEKGEDAEAKGLRRMVHGKYNLSAKAPDLLFRSRNTDEDPRSQFVSLEWTVPEGNVDEESIFGGTQQTNGYDKGERLTAGKWLKTYLHANGESLRAQVFTDGYKNGFRKEALRKAARGLSINSRQEGGSGPCWWSLP